MLVLALMELLQILTLLLLTFPHASKGVLVGLVGTHPTHHFRATHARLVALRVGSHSVPSGKCWISPISKRVLQINATPIEKVGGLQAKYNIGS